MDQLQALQDQMVEVTYNGLAYHGRLAGASEAEIFLMTGTEWVSLPMEGITSVHRVDRT